MARYRMYPTAAQDAVLREHCAQARYVWNLAWNLHQFGQLETYGQASRRVDRDGRRSIHQKRRPVRPLPGYVEQARMLTEARAEYSWLAAGSVVVQQRARLRKAERRAARATTGSPAQKTERACIARLRAREADRRKDWCEKTSTGLARRFDLIRFEDLNIRNMTAKPKARPDPDRPGAYLPNRAHAKSGLNRAILAQGWGLLVQRTIDKAPGRVEKVRAAYTSLRCSACGWIDKNSRNSQAGFSCVYCGFSCNADENAAINIAAGHAGVTLLSVREPRISAA